MNARELYNTIIADIEHSATNCNNDEQNIAFELEKNYKISIRDLSAIFSFMTGTTLISYIKNRRLMASYKYLIESPKWDIQQAIAISGMSDQSSYGKKFTRVFAVSPKEAYKNKDRSLCAPPLTWDAVSCCKNNINTEGGKPNMTNARTMFDIPQSHCENAVQVSALENLYGLGPLLTEVAVKISEDLNVSLSDAFKYADSLHEFGGDFSTDGCTVIIDGVISPLPSPKEYLEQVAFDPFVQFVFFKCNLAVETAYDLLDRTGLSENTLMTYDPNVLRAYASSEMESTLLSHFQKVHEFLKGHRSDYFTGAEFTEFVDLAVYQGYTCEEALDHILLRNSNRDVT